MMEFGMTPVDTGYLRQSAQEIGGLIKDAVSAQLEEVNSLLEMQAQIAQASQAVDAYGLSMNGGIDVLA
ncbi:MAG: hypothetical protein H8E46_10695 [FCB group bacterium]|nr:hypothetical protein [FCB group bacterium]